MNSDLDSLSRKINIQFNDPKLITNAFVHKSYLNESSEYSQSNERLEYLGDAVIELLTSKFLFTKYPDYQEGMLTNLRAALVRTTTLSQLAKDLGLNNLLLMSKGEEETGGRENQSILANVSEAFIGSVYLDQGIDPCDHILQEYLFTKIDQIIANNSYKDSKSSLQELAQAKFKETPIYELVSDSGPDHDKIFQMKVLIGDNEYAIGEGKSKQLAQEEAARLTLEMITNT